MKSSGGVGWLLKLDFVHQLHLLEDWNGRADFVFLG
jgi:hypothetical protein